MTGPVSEGRCGIAASQPRKAPLRCLNATALMASLRRLRSAGGCSLALPTPPLPGSTGTFAAVSTRGLILAALLCGLAILAATAIQFALAR